MLVQSIPSIPVVRSFVVGMFPPAGSFASENREPGDGRLAGEGRRFGYEGVVHAKAEGEETRESETFGGIRIRSGA